MESKLVAQTPSSPNPTENSSLSLKDLVAIARRAHDVDDFIAQFKVARREADVGIDRKGIR